MSDTLASSNLSGVRGAPTLSGGAPEAGRPAPGAAAESDAERAMRAWGRALANLAGAYQPYIAEVSESGSRLLGARWKQAVDIVDSLAGEPLPAGSASLGDFMDAADGFEAAMRQLETAGAVILDENVRTAVATGMSRTYSDTIGGLARAVFAANAALKAAWASMLREASCMAHASNGRALAASDVASFYGRSGNPRGGVATEMYVGALLQLMRDRQPGVVEEAAQLLESAKDVALGCQADSRAMAAADAELLAKYHPLQAMGYVALAAASSAALSAAASSAALCLDLPQARLSVAYDMAPLVDRGRARDFGPLAAMTSGLNYRLVERLRTIRAVPVRSGSGSGSGGDKSRAAIPAIVEGPIAVAAGQSTLSVGSPGSSWAPLAGPRPRVAAYAEAAEAIVLDHLRAERQEDVVARYETAVESGDIPAGETPADVIVSSVLAEFTRLYDKSPPSSPQELQKLAVGTEFDPCGDGSYICAAIAGITGSALDTRLRAALLRPGAPRVPHDVLEREGRISQAVVAVDVARSLWRKIRREYAVDAEMFELTPIRRREAHLKHFRAAVRRAAESSPVHGDPPSLKMHAAMTFDRR